MSTPEALPGQGGDFAKGASGATNVYDTSPTGLGISPAYLAPGASASATSTSASQWTTGDYKMSALAADHDDPGGGSWLLCDGSAIAAGYTGLIATIGANRPDARGRTLVMLGTNASVSSLLANDGQPVANRRSYHRTSLTAPTQPRSDGGPAGATSVVSLNGSRIDGGAIVSGMAVGSGNANDALDTPSFIVPGSLFIHT